jgi:hypothetical protein
LETAIEHMGGKRPTIDEDTARDLFQEAIEKKISGRPAEDQKSGR